LLEGLDGHDRFGVVGVPAFAAAFDSPGDLIALALGGRRVDLKISFEEARVVDQLTPVGHIVDQQVRGATTAVAFE